jgi:outer membrane protein OmpA-like peptidoglycan-associated protein
MHNQNRNRLASVFLSAAALAFSAADSSAENKTTSISSAANAINLENFPMSTASLPAFPYLDWPAGFDSFFGHERISDFDRYHVLVGNKILAIEGRGASRFFRNRNTTLSETAARRNYEALIKKLGGVRVPSLSPDNPSLNKITDLGEQLQLLSYSCSYDTYLVRRTEGNIWIVLMTTKDETKFIVVQEKPMVQSVGLVQASAVKSASTLPPFPYIDWPQGLDPFYGRKKAADFDSVYVITGKEVRAVEGRLEVRDFANRHANLSALAIKRNYENLIKKLGGVKANSVEPDFASWDKLKVPSTGYSYDSFRIKTPVGTAWIVLMVSDSDTRIVAVEEKAMEKTVGFVTAESIRDELAAKGHVPLYINFDTDKASLRPDGEQVVGEILKLLKDDPKLALTIEGHTDNTGAPSHNTELSQKRAEAVVQTLVKGGIDKSRLQAAGYGATKPLADNADEAGRAKNRRVELVERTRS